MKHGCCRDRKYGRGCNDETCMELPAGKTCGDCRHADRCITMFGATAERTHCGWFPRRFAQVVEEPSR